MQRLQHTKFTKHNGQATSPIGKWFAVFSTVNAAGSKDNSDIKRPWFKRYEA